VKIAEVSIRRPVFAVMLIGGLVGLGAVSLPRLGVDMFPKVEFPIVTVSTVLEGAAPDTIEREVTQPLEEAINTIEGIHTLRSVSSEALSQVVVEFGLEYDVHRKAQEVRDKVAAKRGELPAETKAPVVDRIDPDSAPVLSVLLAGPLPIRELSELADKQVKPRLERIPGVGSITLVGARPRELRIWLDPVRLSGYQLAVDEVLAALRREHVEIPGGRIETARSEYSVKTKGKLATTESFGELVVAEREGRTIRLRDVARVEDGMAEERTIARLDGQRGVSLVVRRQSGENTIAVVDAVRADLDRLRPELPPGVQMIEAQDTSLFVRASVHDVAVDIAWGGLLAVLVVLVFLRSGRSTAIAALAIPASLVASFTLFYALDFTLNVMTLMALSLSIGMLIDDAIVVLENVYRHVEAGMPVRRAALEGTREIGLAVMATTFAICAVFVPIAFMGGMVGRFFTEFGLVVTCAVLVSLLVALTLTPMLCSRFLRVQTSHGRVYQALERAYAGLEGGYRRVLEWGLAHRRAVVGIAVAAVVGGAAIARSIPFAFDPGPDRSEFNVWLKMPLGSPPHATLAATARVEELLRRDPDVRSVFSTVGGGAQQRVNESIVYVRLARKHERERTQDEIMAGVRQQVAALALPVQEFAVEAIQSVSFGGTRQAELMYAIRGPDIGRLAALSDALVARMRATSGFTDVSTSLENGKPEIALAIDRDRAADLGVPALQIGTTISALLAGIEVTSFEEGGERFDVRVQVRPEFRDDPLKLDLLRVRSATGALIPLANLVSPALGTGPAQIDRENRTRSAMVFANLDGLALGEADRRMGELAREVGIVGDYELAAAGTAERMKESVAAIGFAFVIALAALYMILASQFDSFLHPFTIMLSAPLSFVGAFAALAVLRFHLDMMSQIGLLMLMGLVMKNGILLVDYINTVRETRGLDVRAAVLEAGPTRLRPVLMTTVAMVFGMLPVAFGQGDGAEFRAPVGVIAIGGLLASTFLTLLVVPVVYTLVDSAQARTLRALGWLGARRPRVAGRSAS
jgi:HAE1 family hydrophobic/amphiphilic exporter-1